MFSNKKNQKLFLSKVSTFNIDSKVDLILSPEFYWVRNFDIPVKTKNEALDVLPTLFEDILPTGEFSYHVVKTDDKKYLCFAYENNSILEYIKKSNLNLSQICNIYFAQTEFKDINSFISKEDAFTYSPEDILIKVPKFYVTTTLDIQDKLKEHKLSSNKINIKFYSSVISSKYIYSFISIFAILITLNIFKYAIYDKNISILEVKSAQIKKSYKMPSSMLETNSIVSKMKSKVKNATALRDSLSYIFDYKKGSIKGKINKINFSANNIKLELYDVNYNQVKRYLEKRFKIVNNTKNKNIVRFEIKI